METFRESPPPVERRWCRRPRVSVRVMAAMILVIAATISWPINRANVQKRAVAAIKKADPRAIVFYDYQYPGGKILVQKATPPGPAWLRRRLGDEFFQEVDTVWIVSPVSDPDLAPLGDFGRLRILHIFDTSKIEGDAPVLKGLHNLERLGLHNPSVDDAWLANVQNLEELRHLNLDGTSVTDAGLRHLAGLTGLESLELSGSIWTYPGRSRSETRNQATDAGLSHLAGLHHLRSLTIADAPGVADLGESNPRSNLPNLAYLSLRGSGLTDAGMAKLEGLTALNSLNLTSTRITDAGLVHLRGMTGLHTLELADTEVTDAGLANLMGLGGLRRLRLNRTKVTRAGVDALREALPMLTDIDPRPE